MKRQLNLWFTLFLLLLWTGTASVMAAETQVYTIKKGDTLWDLSKKFIDDPYYWPNLWSNNPEITNPHLIFPGQKIRFVDGRLEIVPAYTEAPQTPPPTVISSPAEGQQDELVKIKSGGGGVGFILTEEQPLGIIVDSVDNRVMLTKNDIVFVKMSNSSDVTVGDTYGLFERGKLIKHPLTRKPLGAMMYSLGYLQVTDVKGETVSAKISGVFREINRGAELYEYVPQQLEIPLKQATAAAEGIVIATRDNKGTISSGDVIFIDQGEASGVRQGNLFYLTRPRTASSEMIKKAGAIELPDAVLGAAVVIESRDATASAIVIKSVDAAAVGDQAVIVSD